MTISTKRWIGVYLLSLIPVVNIVLLFVWAFSRNTEVTEYSLRTYARATLIMGFILSIVYVAITVAIGATL